MTSLAATLTLKLKVGSFFSIMKRAVLEDANSLVSQDQYKLYALNIRAYIKEVKYEDNYTYP